MSGRSPKFDFFSDFDGTISENDMIAQIMLEFVPDQAKPIIQKVYQKEISIEEGVASMFALIPSTDFERVKRFAVETTKIRAGFSEFAAFCKEEDWRLSVVSGGFDFFVRAALEPVQHDIEIHCNRIDASGEFLKVIWSVPCEPPCQGGCGLCKPTVLQRAFAPGSTQVVIGDGVTDMRAAGVSDYVFARDKLRLECERTQTPHTAFETFFDIIRALKDPDSEVYRYAK